jgi:V8-like Glu-specific endopeptidase
MGVMMRAQIWRMARQAWGARRGALRLCGCLFVGMGGTIHTARADAPGDVESRLVGESQTTLVAYDFDSGRVDVGAAPVSRLVVMPGASSLRLHFGDTDLPKGTWLRIVNLADGQEQVLDAAALSQWNWSSAYFNGDALELRLETKAARLSPGRKPRPVLASVRLRELEVGPGQCGICGTDDRVPSQQAWAGRLAPGGCSASVVCEDSTVLTAGHCSGNTIIQFNVPATLPGCVGQNPPVADQFPLVVLASSQSGGGSDWAILRAGLNSLGQTPWDRYQAKISVSLTTPVVGATSSVVGYGWDSTCERAMTQQTSPGSIVQTFETYTSFNNDVRSVSSGSPLIVDGAMVAVVTNCSTCANFGTSVRQTQFSSALGQHVACRNNAAVAITSQTPGVSVTITPNDNGAQGGGMLPLSRTYLAGTPIRVTAPQTVGDRCFVQWKIGGSTYSTQQSVDYTVGLHGTTLEAMYAQPPVVVTQPQPMTNCTGSELSFQVTATPTTFVSFQWRRNGVIITGNNNPERRYSGMSTNRLSIVNAQPSDTGTFDVIITTPCGNTTSNGAALLVVADCANACDTIDFNRDGIFPDTNDLDVFIHVLAGGSCADFPGGGMGGAVCGDLDFNNDGLSPDSLDLDAFVSRLAGGPCVR